MYLIRQGKAQLVLNNISSGSIYRQELKLAVREYASLNRRTKIC